MRWMRALPLVLILGLVGCGTTPSAAPPPSSPSTATTTTSPSNSATTTTSTSNSATTIKLGTATVKGKKETVLTDSQGLTLYYFTSDTSSKVACTGGCASLWPPLLSTSGSPTAASGVKGTLKVLTDPNGQQVMYNGHPLYTYSGDSAPGQANGQGYIGKWWVATPGLKATSGSSTSSGGGW